MADMTMLPEELQELMADVAHVKLQDVHLGRVLEKLTTHLAHAHGLDPAALAEEEVPAEEVEADQEEGEGSDEVDNAPAAPTAPTTKGKGK